MVIVTVIAPAPPLVIDLDGPLLRTDLLLETGVEFIRHRPLDLLKMMGWLIKGKAALKEGLALATDIDVSVLPYDLSVIELIKTERSTGRTVILATASHFSLAERVAEHLQLFDQVLASDGQTNLSSHRKRDLLVKHYGEQGFDYAGNSRDDIAVWGSARHAFVVNPDRGVEGRARAQGNVVQVIRSNCGGPRDWMKALRMHQWMKNALIFVPLLAAHQLTNSLLLLQGVLAFLFFGLCASSVYLLNDLLDLADDRHHRSKCRRPFAAGYISIKAGLVVFPILLIASFSGAILLQPLEFAGVLATYYALTVAYSLYLKRLMAIDVIALAMLYTVRIIAGAAAFELPSTRHSMCQSDPGCRCCTTRIGPTVIY
ncbi:4-hydroxybenzoate octaprenyltransferase [Pseudomonas fluorescens]|uniref:4-hydroxybenzoate octaprenyltransferase n=1 Tax=Pseudomonas fluorescens TaxID=294 RepID=A0A5E7ESD3_PSEFL|nr:4-hydroxybenzoate octaprenyltransferase [Pseudomonas fluorescens]